MTTTSSQVRLWVQHLVYGICAVMLALPLFTSSALATPAELSRSSTANAAVDTPSQREATLGMPIQTERLTDEGPGGPILVVINAANPFTHYTAEILRTEGLNAFLVSDIASVDASVLAAYDVVILGDMTLTPAHVTMFSNWVTAGGNLIAMRPDKQLAGLLGLTDASATLADAYLLVNTAAAPGAGIVDQTIQFHGTADRYTLSGAASVATLYSSATTATTHPAVTLRSVGANGGQAAAFTYDLARSVVTTRQGNPAWSGQERDGLLPLLVRANDLFWGAAAADPQPDWIDLTKVAIPQADEQQRLLANLILHMNADKKPLPRFWYFPRGAKAVVIMTSDAHVGTGTAGRFDDYKAMSPADCSVVDWECIRSSGYLDVSSPLTAAQAATYTADGFEVGLHVNAGCEEMPPASLDLQAAYNNDLNAWQEQYPDVSAPVSERTHCVPWGEYATQPQIQFAHGIRLDTNYYYWPDSWAAANPGFFTGSGLPMRFADLDGTLIDVFQAATQMTDESGQAYPDTVITLLERALGSEGYYGAFTANMHADDSISDDSEAIVTSALMLNVPVVSGRQMLTWLDGRNASSFGGLAWSGNSFSFSIAVGVGATGLQALLPTSSSAGGLASLTRDGAPVAYTVQTVKGISYAVFPASAGAYVATYDGTSPVIADVIATPSTYSAMIAWSTSEAADSRVDYGTAANALNLTVSDTGLVTAHSLTLSGLLPNTPYDYRVTSKDAANNTATQPPAGDTPASFTTPAFTCPCSIWNASAMPANPAATDTNPIEVGVKFRTDVAGYITGLRFYKGVENTGVHVGHLWRADGTQLAAATFTGETASGWQQVTLASPIPVLANTTYIASYFSPSGYFAFDENFFATGVDSPPLHALAAGVDGPNGVYLSGTSGFPTAGTTHNYWVDVVFDTTAVDTIPPTISNVAAAPGVATAAITWATNEAADSRVDYGTAPNALTLSATAAALVTGHSLTLSGLAPNTPYYYRVTSKDAANNTATQPPTGDPPASFTTLALTCPCSIWPISAAPANPPASDGHPIEVGVKFRIDVAGYITGIRFYKGIENTGIHVGHLWRADGTQLAAATFTGETASGWQQVTLASPIPVLANTTYIASYYSSDGFFSLTDDGLASGVSNPPLHALAGNVADPNGVYLYDASGFPTDGSDYNYWVDVAFDTTAVQLPAAPVLSIEYLPPGIELKWQHLVTAYTAYEVRRSSNPYFDPVSGESRATINTLPDLGSTVSYPDTTAVGGNFFYVVRGLFAQSGAYIDSNRTGIFRLTLTPGQ